MINPDDFYWILLTCNGNIFEWVCSCLLIHQVVAKIVELGMQGTPAKRMVVEGYNALVQGKIDLGNCNFVMALFGFP